MMKAIVKLAILLQILQIHHLQAFPRSETNYSWLPESANDDNLLLEAKEDHQLSIEESAAGSNNNSGQEEGEEEPETSIGLDELAEETGKLSGSIRNRWLAAAVGGGGGGGRHDDNAPTTQEQQHPNRKDDFLSRSAAPDKRLFVVELLKMLHEQYGSSGNQKMDGTNQLDTINNKEDRHQPPISKRQMNMMSSLLEAISAEGDIRRLKDWVRNSFNLASMGELTTQFVVSKLGSVNCASLIKPDPEESLVPRFLLFNEHYVDVPYELTMAPTSNECLVQGRFDPLRKTIVLVHGYLTGYTLVDGMTNIKNRLLDINKIANERAMVAFTEASLSNGSYLLTGDLESKLRRQKYNVIIVDWFSGANPVPRANYIQAAANARVVGEIIARFLMTLATQCRTPSTNIQIMAHSLGCHVAGFTGKAMSAAGHTLGKITHLDPIGLCFGRLFSNPRVRLSPNDAMDTQAVHVSLNLFDNPLDGARSNFLVNGGRDQIGCQGNSELQNSTTSSVSLLFNPGAKFSPCSHLRALSLFEDDLSSSPGLCQIVGYRCATYERFLAGKCGKCDASNNQCRLMGFPPILKEFTGINLGINNLVATQYRQQQQIKWDPNLSSKNSYPYPQVATSHAAGNSSKDNSNYIQAESHGLLKLVKNHSNGSIAWVIDDQELNVKIGNAIAKMKPKLVTTNNNNNNPGDLERQSATGSSATAATSGATEAGSSSGGGAGGGSASRRSDRRLIGDFAHTLDKIRAETKSALTGGWTSIMSVEPKYKVGSIINSLASPSSTMGNLFSGLMMPQVRPPSIDLDLNLDDNHHKLISLPAVTVGAGSIDTPIAVVGSPGKVGSGPEQQQQQQKHQQHQHQEEDETIFPAPIGSQPLPAGSSIGPLYFVGTSAMSPYCVNYYQFRMLIAESRIKNLMQSSRSSPNRMAHISSHGHPKNSQQDKNPHKTYGHHLQNRQHQQQQQVDEDSTPSRQATLSRDMLHLTVKLSDSRGHFFKGFTLVEDVRLLPRAPASELMGTRGPTSNEMMVELTMLLNSTNPEPVRIGETIISNYFHGIVLADTIEIDYMSNISPNIRAKYSSILCPMAINDQHQLVRYIECNKIAAR